jgi:hypothetical protein
MLNANLARAALCNSAKLTRLGLLYLEGAMIGGTIPTEMYVPSVIFMFAKTILRQLNRDVLLSVSLLFADLG